VLLSVLLGSHPPHLPVRALVRIGGLLGVSEGTVRVALSRMAATGEVEAADGWYRLSPALVQRQRHLDHGRVPRLRAWRGAWEMAVVRDPTDAAECAAVEMRLARAGLASLRAQVWLRPDNLARPAEEAAFLRERCDWFVGYPTGDPADLARRLWDLPGWAAEGEALLAALRDAEEPARRFVLAAAVARHLRDDPLLPRSMLPGSWPGPALRQAYADYERELSALLRSEAGADNGPRPSGRAVRTVQRAQ
jgi:phenylacetic acid degradation operon negative regulatory protein